MVLTLHIIYLYEMNECKRRRVVKDDDTGENEHKQNNGGMLGETLLG